MRYRPTQEQLEKLDLYINSTLWGKELDEKAADTVDATCGFYDLPGLTDGSDVFAAIVEAAQKNARIIATEPLRAAIAFKWAKFGRRQWLRQVGEYVAFLAGYMGGSGLLLLGNGSGLVSLSGQVRIARAPPLMPFTSPGLRPRTAYPRSLRRRSLLWPGCSTSSTRGRRSPRCATSPPRRRPS